MLAQMPDTVQLALGDVAVRDFTAWLEAVMAERTVGKDTWSQVQVRFDGVDRRLDGVETRLEGVETRLVHVETRLDRAEHDLGELKIEVREFRREVNERFDRVIAMFNDRFDRQAAETNARFGELNARFERLDVTLLMQTRWTVGTLALFGTIIAILVGIGQLRA